MTNVNERFVPLKNFPNILISENGVVYHAKKNKIIPHNSFGGYLGVCLRKKNCKPINYLVHRLVAETFIWNRDNKDFVNHKDGNKLNPKLTNLEWCTAKENAQHAVKFGLTNHTSNIGIRNSNSVLNELKVLKIRKYSKEGKTQSELALKFGVSQANINQILNNKIWRHVPQI